VEKGVQEILLVIEDFGVGITEENQKSLFEGLFHTQETDLYSSKTPYNFNAGGKGLFLLQAKIYGQRFGFDLIMESRRCRYIPRNSDLCPGRISDCNDCRRPEDCLASGGSIFSLSFPLRRG
jgi:signal transduction histidine kinase